MGLAAPRKRRKLAEDPNNTTWSRSTDNYGQRILAAQGWTPGSYLGARSAPHAAHYSAASASHVRVLQKDDNLGLGAPRSQEIESTGLGNFQDLLGRLNGRAVSQIEGDREARKTLGAKLYAQQRWGATSFVMAGYLVGDKIETQFPGSLSMSEDSHAHKHRRARDEGLDATSSHGSDAAVTTDHAALGASAAADAEPTGRDEKRRHKQEKRARKEEHRRNKEERRRRKEARRAAKVRDAKPGLPETATAEHDKSVDSRGQQIESGKAVEARQSAASSRGGLNVRQRYLQQKRKAAMDPQALREILMIKS